MSVVHTPIPEETTIVKWLADREPEMINLLEALVNTDSGSYYKQGVDEVGSLIKGFFEARGIACDTIPIETHGDVVRATVSAASNGGNRPIVLMGHRDTVFPRGEPDRRPFTISARNGLPSPLYGKRQNARQ